MNKLAVNKYGQLISQMNDLKLDPDKLQSAVKGTQIISMDNTELVEELRKIPKTEIHMDERGFTLRQMSRFNRLTRQQNRFFS